MFDSPIKNKKKPKLNNDLIFYLLPIDRTVTHSIKTKTKNNNQFVYHYIIVNYFIQKSKHIFLYLFIQ